MALPFACVLLYIGVPDQALGWFPLGLGLVAKMYLLNFHVHVYWQVHYLPMRMMTKTAKICARMLARVPTNVFSVPAYKTSHTQYDCGNVVQ